MKIYIIKYNKSQQQIDQNKRMKEQRTDMNSFIYYRMRPSARIFLEQLLMNVDERRHERNKNIFVEFILLITTGKNNFIYLE
mmetsp:Transcript_530/g.711  ORF Transcript_530/g.711 Transcript_530/m.711 type:complete len:82 (-) Transcript_530:135-380(-)